MSDSDISNNLKAALERSPECPALEALASSLEGKAGEEARAKAERHVSECAHCKTELALLRDFEQMQIRPEEELPVRFIVNSLRKSNPAEPKRAAEAFNWKRIAPLAACLALVAGGTLYLRDGRTVPPLDGSGPQVVRSQSLDVVAPVGDLARAPAELRWKPVAGAVKYEVRLSDVAREEIWHAETSALSIALPATVAEQVVPGKSLVWQVAARDSSGAELATSGPQKFRLLR